MRMRADLNELQDSTGQLLEAYFTGSLSQKALRSTNDGPGQCQQAPQQWQVGYVEVGSPIRVVRRGILSPSSG